METKVIFAVEQNTRRGESKLTESAPPLSQSVIRGRSPKQVENLIGGISVGFVFILFASVYVIALPANLFERVVNFFGTLTLSQVPGTGIFLPAPINPGAHTVVYAAAFQFCLGIVFLQLIILLLRLVWNSPVNKTAEALGNVVYWSGAAYLTTTFLNLHTTINTWFAFWAGILVVIGISLNVRAIVLLVKR